MRRIALIFALVYFVFGAGTAEAKAIRVECGLGGLPNPHGGNAPYIALYRYQNMSAYKILFFHYEHYQYDGEIDAKASSLEPAKEWPLLTGVLRHRDGDKELTTVMKIDEVTSRQPPSEDGTVEFTAKGTLQTDVYPAQKIPLECYGLYNLAEEDRF